MTEIPAPSIHSLGAEATILGDERWSRTQVKVTKFSNTWTIENFSLRHEKTGEKLTSLTFSASPMDNLKWSLEVYPRGETEENKNYLSIFLRLVSAVNNQVRLVQTCSILNDKLEKKEVKSDQEMVNFAQIKAWGWKKFIPLDVLFDKSKGLLPNDILTLHWEVRLVEDSVHTKGRYKRIQITPQCQVWNELGQLLDTQKLSDVVLNVKGHQFHAHKAILAARSSVFSAMFEHEMEEKKQSRVEIIDLDQEVVGEMLRFIYTDRAPKLETMAADLIAAADKYALDRLKAMCEEVLSKNLSVESAARALVLADKYSAGQLKSYAIDFMKTHATEMIETLVHRQLHHLTETCKALITQEKPET